MLYSCDHLDCVCAGTSPAFAQVEAHCRQLSASADSLISAAENIITSMNRMTARCTVAISYCASDFSNILTKLSSICSQTHRCCNDRARHRDKWLDDKAEEADTASKQLDACAALCAADVATVTPLMLLHDIGSVDVLASNFEATAAGLSFQIIANPSSTPFLLRKVCKIWQEFINVSASKVDGRGSRCYVKGAVGLSRNIVTIRPCVSGGLEAKYVRPSDVQLVFTDESGCLIDANVSCLERVKGDMAITFAYAVLDGCSSMLSLQVYTCGIACGPALRITCDGFDVRSSKLKISHPDVFPSKSSVSIAVNQSEDYLVAVSTDAAANSVLRVYRLPSVELVREISALIGRIPKDESQFRSPGRLCFTPSDSILVCDAGHDRVIHVTLEGECIHEFPVLQPCSVAVHDQTMAVGTSNGIIELYAFRAGEFISRFSIQRSPAPTSSKCLAVLGLLFTADGSSLLFTRKNSDLSLFSRGGVFVKQFADAALRNTRYGYEYDRDDCARFAITATGEIVVSERLKQTFHVFSLDGRAIQTWLSTGYSRWGTGRNKDFESPVFQSICAVGSRLYIADDTLLRILE